MHPGDKDAWLQVFDWIAHFDSLIDQNTPEDLRLFVADDSAPSFRTQPTQE
jgi:hypothetical protein